MEWWWGEKGGKKTRVCLKLLLIRGKVTHQLAVDDIGSFINERLHRQRPVPHVQGVGGLRQDPSYAQRTFIVQIPGYVGGGDAFGEGQRWPPAPGSQQGMSEAVGGVDGGVGSLP